MFAVEKGLLYAKSHEWAKVEGDTATIGISDFAQASWPLVKSLARDHRLRLYPCQLVAVGAD